MNFLNFNFARINDDIFLEKFILDNYDGSIESSFHSYTEPDKTRIKNAVLKTQMRYGSKFNLVIDPVPVPVPEVIKAEPVIEEPIIETVVEEPVVEVITPKKRK